MITGSSSRTPEEQLRLACAELRRRLAAGEVCRAEEFLQAFPAVAARADLALELILAEAAARHDLGQEPTTAEWDARFPHLADRLRQHLMADAAPGNAAGTLPATEVEAATATRPNRDAAPPQPCWSFGRYEVLEELGHGGMGRVFKARDTVLGRLVALKVLRGGIAAHPEELFRFHREAQAVARLRHRHIVPVYDLGDRDGQPYLTMAYLPGGTLAERRERFAGDVRASVALVEKVARAVQAAHEQGVVHRDLKPGNVLLDEAGEPLVSDFGLAKVLGAGEEVTQSGQVLGTPAYMAPEQAAGQGHEATPASDVWALGVILYELLTGRRPFEGKGAELTRRVQFTRPAGPREINPALDRGLEAILLKCLEKSPPCRYSSAGALADELGRWLRAEPVQARPKSWARAAWSRARRHPVLAVAVLCLLGAAVLGALALGRDRPHAEAVALFVPQADPPGEGWRLGQGEIQAEGAGVWRLKAKADTPGLFELRSSPPWPRYRFQVEVQDAGAAGRVGIYVGHHVADNPGGTEHWFYDLSLAERDEFFLIPNGKRRYAGVTLVARRCGTTQGPAGPGFDHRREVPRPTYFPARRGAWRQLALEVTPDKICAFWDGQSMPFTALPHAAVLEDYRRQLAALPPLSPAPPPASPATGGLGLFSEGGEALFRAAVLTPLGGQDQEGP